MVGTPLFSIIIPTRDRSEMCIAALESIQSQSTNSVEVVVVDDGSDAHHKAKLAEFATTLKNDKKQWTWLELPRRETGHGVAFVRNFGVAQSKGRFVGMLDDDDSWIDTDYLAKIETALTAAGAEFDLFLSNQVAYKVGETRQEAGPIWIERLEGIVKTRGGTMSDHGLYEVTVDDLLQVGGFCHLNTTIVKRTLFDAVGGFDPCLRYESDRDIYLRFIDHAQSIAHLPDTVARHNIPQKKLSANVSTRVSAMDKHLFQVRILQKATLKSKHKAIRRKARTELAIVYKHLSKIAEDTGDGENARLYAAHALACDLSFKWAVYTAWLTVKRA